MTLKGMACMWLKIHTFFLTFFFWKWYTFFVRLTPFAKCISRWFPKNLVYVPHLLDDVYGTWYGLVFLLIFNTDSFCSFHINRFYSSYIIIYILTILWENVRVLKHIAPHRFRIFQYILILQWFYSLILRMHIGFFYHFCISVIWVDNGQFKSSVFS